MRKVSSYKCPVCKKAYSNISGWGSHMNKIHPDDIPKGYTPARYFYYLQTKRTHGNCVVCKKKTNWNEETYKYERFCTDPKCKAEYREIFKKRMINKYGKVHLLNDPKTQKEMLRNRRISGKYTFEDGGKVEYVGTYEKDFLSMMDTFMKFNSEGIMSPSPHTYYYDYVNPNDKENEGRKFYIPDYFIPSLNLEIEIKASTNTHHKIQRVDMVKEKIKDEVMNRNPNISYIKILDKDYTKFFEMLVNLKENFTVKRVNERRVSMESSGVDYDDPDYPSTSLSSNIDTYRYTGMEIGTEGIISDFISKAFGSGKSKVDIISSWKDKIFMGSSNQLVGKNLSTLKYFTNKKVLVDESLQIISIQNINIRMLFNRIKETYGERRLDLIFDRTFHPSSIRRFKRKKITRGQMRVTSLNTPVFFALELTILFRELYEKYRDPTYAHIVNSIFNNTWLAEADNSNDVSSLSLKNLDRFNDKYKLQPHQTEFISSYRQLKSHLNLRGYILAFEQGLGKTLTSLGLAECVNADRIYIICPNSLKQNWKEEIVKYYKIFSNKDLIETKIAICDKDIVKVDPKVKFIITNNEAIAAMDNYIFNDNKKSILIIDEVHNFRNMKGKRVQELVSLRDKLNPNDILALSGTPIKATPNEIVPTMLLLDPLFTTHAAELYNKCFKLDTTLAMNIVQHRFGKIMYRKTKEVLTLPDKNLYTLEYPIAESDKYSLMSIREEVGIEFDKFYEEMMKDNIALRDEYLALIKRYSTSDMNEYNKYSSYITKYVNTNKSSSLHELDQEFYDNYIEKYVSPNIHSNIDVKRLDELSTKFLQMKRSAMGKAIGLIYPKYRAEMYIAIYEENKEAILKMIDESSKKTIIFSQIKPVVEYIYNDLMEMGYGSIKVVGGGTTTARRELINAFKNDDQNEVLVATSQTLGTGETLVEASQMFFFGTPWRSTDFDQCCDRIHRIGQTEDVFIYTVKLKSSKKNLSDRMDEIMKWSNTMFKTLVDGNENIPENL